MTHESSVVPLCTAAALAALVFVPLGNTNLLMLLLTGALFLLLVVPLAVAGVAMAIKLVGRLLR